MTQQLSIVEIDPALFGGRAINGFVPRVVVLADDDAQALEIARQMATPGLTKDEVTNGRHLATPDHLDAVKSDLANGEIVIDKTDVPLTLAKF